MAPGLLTIPLEVRSEILRHVFDSSTVTIDEKGVSTKVQVTILLASKQLHDEAQPILIATTTLRFQRAGISGIAPVDRASECPLIEHVAVEFDSEVHFNIALFKNLRRVDIHPYPVGYDEFNEYTMACGDVDRATAIGCLEGALDTELKARSRKSYKSLQGCWVNDLLKDKRHIKVVERVRVRWSSMDKTGSFTRGRWELQYNMQTLKTEQRSCFYDHENVRVTKHWENGRVTTSKDTIGRYMIETSSEIWDQDQDHDGEPALSSEDLALVWSWNWE